MCSRSHPFFLFHRCSFTIHSGSIACIPQIAKRRKQRDANIPEGKQPGEAFYIDKTVAVCNHHVTQTALEYLLVFALSDI